MSLRIGVDVGGTNTDGVLIDATATHRPDRGILATHKLPTTIDVSEGIEAVIRCVLDKSGVDPLSISCVSIGTTAFINAALEADGRLLNKVAVIRLCGPYTRQAPPFIDFPERLKELTMGHVGYVDGGLEIDGRPILPINEGQIIEQCDVIKSKGICNIVLSGVFSPLDNEGTNETRVRDIILGYMGGTSVNVVCSREVGQVGLLERENASILNASLLAFARRTIRGFVRAIRSLSLVAPLYITQNDGTLTSAASASRLPIRTFASGPTNSMRGASFLAGLDLRAGGGKSTIMVDIGGTTTDVGVLMPSGFPRQAASFIEIAGVRTNFSMADVQSIGLGGGSKVVQSKDGRVLVGPESVGREIGVHSLVYGGQVLTVTDLVVANGQVSIGDPTKASNLGDGVVSKGLLTVKRLLEGIIDKMKTSPEDTTVLLVGGGGIIAPQSLKGVGEIIRPPFFDVANAVGAAMAKVAYEIDTIEILGNRALSDVIDNYKQVAISRANAAGADPATTKIVEVANLPIPYVTNTSTRIIVKAAGDLSSTARNTSGDLPDDKDAEELPNIQDTVSNQIIPGKGEAGAANEGGIESYRPHIRSDRQWLLSEIDLEWIADGCSILGAGGGGTSYPPFLMARQQLREGKQILVVDPEDVPEDALFVRCGFMGSPSVSSERIQCGIELSAALEALQKFMGFEDFAGTISEEIGGGNGVQPLVLSGALGKPTLDADVMGRAYPHMWQSLPGAYNIENGNYPKAIADGVGNALVVSQVRDGMAVENILRTICTEMGSKAGVISAPLTRKTCQAYGIPRTVSQAWRMGRAVALCRKRNDLQAIPSSLLELQNGACLFVGKIIDVKRFEEVLLGEK
ncbi:hypothetical protein HGRIS_001852 [Hohenbuehelia grisea]|uniref:Hydantoinase n=1 Tax=Hohenbuehelia grisea TaxID=104357 RepID=A0ABR3JIP2_9AGAR